MLTDIWFTSIDPPYPSSSVFNVPQTPKIIGHLPPEADVSAWTAAFAAYSDSITFTNNVACFKVGTKILCHSDITGQEEYIAIEDITKDMKVKTLNNGYKSIHQIGKMKFCNQPGKDRIKDKIYKCPKSQYPELFEDLYITGCHSILVDSLTQDYMDKIQIITKYLFITDNKYRLPACVDQRTEMTVDQEQTTVYHIALENDNYYSNYGIYANGLLVESCSKRYIIEKSNMQLLF